MMQTSRLIGLRLTGTARRALWTSSTLTSTSPRSLLQSIPSRQAKAPVTLYAVSKHFPQDLLPELRSTLASTSTTLIGCLAEPIPSSSSSLSLDDSTSLPSASIPPFTLSISQYTPSTETERVIPFSTSLTGRPNVSLGREHKPRAGGRATEEELEFENRQFEKFLNGDKNWAFGDQLSSLATESTTAASSGKVAEIPELRDVELSLLPPPVGNAALELTSSRTNPPSPRDVQEIVCFTADRIQPFLSVLSQFPNSRTVGMTSTSTPFHSVGHHPFSLLYNDKISAAGAVGVAVVDSGTSPSASKVEIDYGNLTRFGPITTVTASRGNILLTLSSQNAAQLLLSSVQSLPSSNSFTGDSYDSSSPFEASLSNPNERTTKHISKEKDFYAALFSPEDLPLTGDERQGQVDLGRAKLVCRIMAGDPKRGAVSFETEEEVAMGDRVIFLHRPSTPSTETSSSPPPPCSPLDSTPSTFSFQTIEPSYVSPIESTSPELENVARVETRDGFYSFTENGIIVSRESRRDALLKEEVHHGTREVRLTAIEGTTVRLVSQ